jgi:hypothetical protein
MLVKFIIIVLIIAAILWIAVSEFLNLLQDAVRRSNIKKDTGLRGTYQGRLYVDKSVFYKRPEVQQTINKLKTKEMNTYKNRYGDQFTFTLDSDKNILWEGDFNYCRIGYPNDYTKAYNAYVADGGLLNFNEFKKAVHEWDEDKREYPHVKYLNLVTSNKDIINMVDASGGPYIEESNDMGRYGEEFKGMVVRGFERIDTGYKILIKK